jgi:Domain of unknown function (DUF3576)
MLWISRFGRFLALAVLLSLGACESLPVVQDTPKDKNDRRKEEMGKAFGEDAFTFGGRSGRSAREEESVGLGVNTYLWRASLDTVAFMPLSSADPFGGVIITDWYAPPETPNERFKVTIYILGRQLRSDGLRAAVFKQIEDRPGNWRDVDVAKTTATDLENKILTRARQIRVQTAGG